MSGAAWMYRSGPNGAPRSTACTHIRESDAAAYEEGAASSKAAFKVFQRILQPRALGERRGAELACLPLHPAAHGRSMLLREQGRTTCMGAMRHDA